MILYFCITTMFQDAKENLSSEGEEFRDDKAKDLTGNSLAIKLNCIYNLIVFMMVCIGVIVHCKKSID